MPAAVSSARAPRLPSGPPRLLLLLLLATSAAGQPATAPTAIESDTLCRLAADEQALWIAAPLQPGPQPVWRLFRRDAAGAFESGPLLSERIVSFTAVPDGVLVFFADGSAYRYLVGQQRPLAERVLPRRRTPIDIFSAGQTVYGIVPSAAAAILPAIVPEQPAATQPFDPGSAALSLLAYDGHQWHAVTALPAEIERPRDAELRPRLCATGADLFLFAPDDRSGLRCWRLDDQNRWQPDGRIDTGPLTTFWPLTCNRLLTLLTLGPDDPAPRAYRPRLADDGRFAQWRQVALNLSPLPEAETARYLAAGGFNQHVVLLLIDQQGRSWLQFGRIAGQPAESSFSIDALVARQTRHDTINVWVQGITLLLLIFVLMGLFVFRRGSLTRIIILPPGCALALGVQRLFGWLIDFLPFATVAAYRLHIDPREGLASLAGWGITQSADAGLPSADVLWWWSLTVGGHTLYMLVFELLTGRSLGKLIAQMRVISESAPRASAGQIVARNLCRLIELLPHFWVFAFLVVLSRNRQRLGDILARTVVVRRLRLPAGKEPREPTDPPRDPPAGSGPPDADRQQEEDQP